MPTLYSLRAHPKGFMMAKFDDDFNVTAVYELHPVHTAAGASYSCECPAGVRPSCKHRKMVPIFIRAQAVDTSRFYCYETQSWHQPIPTQGEGEATAEAAVTYAGKGPEPSTLAAEPFTSPSASGRGQPAPAKPTGLRRL